MHREISGRFASEMPNEPLIKDFCRTVYSEALAHWSTAHISRAFIGQHKTHSCTLPPLDAAIPTRTSLGPPEPTLGIDDEQIYISTFLMYVHDYNGR